MLSTSMLSNTVLFFGFPKTPHTQTLEAKLTNFIAQNTTTKQLKCTKLQLEPCVLWHYHACYIIPIKDKEILTLLQPVIDELGSLGEVALHDEVVIQLTTKKHVLECHNMAFIASRAR